MVCRPEDVAAALAFAKEQYSIINQELNSRKTKIWSPTQASLLSLPEAFHAHCFPYLKCLGTHLRMSGDQHNTDIDPSDPTQPFQQPIDRLTTLTNALTELQPHGLKRQVATTLLWHYASASAQHVARNYFVTDTMAAEWDNHVISAWESILRVRFTRDNPLLALPRRKAGLHITDMATRHHAAIWGIWGALQKALPHITETTDSLPTTAQFVRACPTIAQSLDSTQQALARSTNRTALAVQPLSTALKREDTQKVIMDMIQDHTLAELHRRPDISPTTQALLHSQTGRGTAAFLAVPCHTEYIADDEPFTTAVMLRAHENYAGAPPPPQSTQPLAQPEVNTTNASATTPIVQSAASSTAAPPNPASEIPDPTAPLPAPPYAVPAPATNPTGSIPAQITAAPIPCTPAPPCCPNRAHNGQACSKPLDPYCVHARLCAWGGGVVRRHNAVVKALAHVITTATGAHVHLERREAELARIFRGQVQHGQMDIVVIDYGSKKRTST